MKEVNMNTQEKIEYLKKSGITIKLLSKLSNIAESTLYSYTSGKRNLSIEKEEKLSAILDNLINILKGE
jgi:transcriptional regulator with XRE-family HTH domain